MKYLNYQLAYVFIMFVLITLASCTKEDYVICYADIEAGDQIPIGNTGLCILDTNTVHITLIKGLYRKDAGFTFGDNLEPFINGVPYFESEYGTYFSYGNRVNLKYLGTFECYLEK